MRLLAATFFLASSALAAPQYDADRLLNAIAHVEQHHADWLGGRYAMTLAAWSEVTTWGYHLSRQPYYADRVARWRLERLASRLRGDGIVVTPYTLAACWHLGYAGFVRENSRGWVNYAVRVEALYFEK